MQHVAMAAREVKCDALHEVDARDDHGSRELRRGEAGSGRDIRHGESSRDNRSNSPASKSNTPTSQVPPTSLSTSPCFVGEAGVGGGGGVSQLCTPRAEGIKLV